MSPTLGRIWNFFTFSLFTTFHITTFPSQLEDALKSNTQKGKIRFYVIKYEHIKWWVTCIKTIYLHEHVYCIKSKLWKLKRNFSVLNQNGYPLSPDIFSSLHSTLTRNSSLGSKATLNTGASCPSNFFVSPEEISTIFIVKSLKQMVSMIVQCSPLNKTIFNKRRVSTMSPIKRQ